MHECQLCFSTRCVGVWDWANHEVCRSDCHGHNSVTSCCFTSTFGLIASEMFSTLCVSQRVSRDSFCSELISTKSNQSRTDRIVVHVCVFCLPPVFREKDLLWLKSLQYTWQCRHTPNLRQIYPPALGLTGNQQILPNSERAP